MELRKIRDEGEARGALAAVVASGLPRSAWARLNGINPRSLNVWQINLERRERRDRTERDRTQSLRLVEVTPVRVEAAAYALVFDDVRLEVDDGFREETLRRLLRVLRSC